MKTLEFHRNIEKDRVTVACAQGEVSAHSHCAYCMHCAGVRVGKRVLPTPQQQALKGSRGGTELDESLLNAAMMFNSLVRDGDSIECSDDEGTGFASMYRH